jgi:recombination protein RecA
VKKNKVAPPFKVAEFDILYDQGISREGEVLDLGVEYGVVDKRGSFYSYGEERLAQGRENVKQHLREHPQVAFEIEARIREMAGLPSRQSPQSGGGSGDADEDEVEELAAILASDQVLEPAEAV